MSESRNRNAGQKELISGKQEKQDANKKQDMYISVSSRSIVKRATAFQITKMITALSGAFAHD